MNPGLTRKKLELSFPIL